MIYDALGLGLLLVGLALVVVELTLPGYYIGVAGTLGIVTGLLTMMFPGFLTDPKSGAIVALVAIAAACIAFQFYKRFAPPVRPPEARPRDESGSASTEREDRNA